MCFASPPPFDSNYRLCRARHVFISGLLCVMVLLHRTVDTVLVRYCVHLNAFSTHIPILHLCERDEVVSKPCDSRECCSVKVCLNVFALISTRWGSCPSLPIATELHLFPSLNFATLHDTSRNVPLTSLGWQLDCTTLKFYCYEIGPIIITSRRLFLIASTTNCTRCKWQRCRKSATSKHCTGRVPHYGLGS